MRKVRHDPNPSRVCHSDKFDVLCSAVGLGKIALDDGHLSRAVANLLFMQHNHLKRYRKRGALTQAEIAFLMGAECGTKVSRHERALRPPSLHSALAYQAIFGVPVHELFPADFRRAADDVRARAAQLARTVGATTETTRVPFKQKLLASAGNPVSPSKSYENQSQ